MKYVAYYRVSTEKQGSSGLGLASQAEHVRRYVEEQKGQLLGEYTEVETGASENRVRLEEAIELCVKEKATLVSKCLSRIVREGYKYQQMLDTKKVTYIDCTSPFDTPVLKDIKIALAKEERRKISSRTKDALQQIKNEIKRVGKYTTKSGEVITSLGNGKNEAALAKARVKSVESRRKRALENPNNARATGFILPRYDKGDGYTEIARQLNECGMRTSKGYEFTATQVKRLHDRVK